MKLKKKMAEEISTFRGFVERFREVYFDEIKPLIEMGEYEVAECSLRNILLAVQTEKDVFNYKQVPTVNSGLSLLASIEVMHQKLERKSFNPKRDFNCLESYLAQTRLPVESGR